MRETHSTCTLCKGEWPPSSCVELLWLLCHITLVSTSRTLYYQTCIVSCVHTVFEKKAKLYCKVLTRQKKNTIHTKHGHFFLLGYFWTAGVLMLRSRTSSWKWVESVRLRYRSSFLLLCTSCMRLLRQLKSCVCQSKTSNQCACASHMCSLMCTF